MIFERNQTKQPLTLVGAVALFFDCFDIEKMLSGKQFHIFRKGYFRILHLNFFDRAVGAVVVLFIF